MRTNTEVRSALPSPKPSLPRGLLRGEPPNVPKNRQGFFEKFPFLSFSYTWKKRKRGISNYGTGPAESRDRLRLRDTAPPHHPTPKSLMNAKFLAEVYLSRIREHGNRVKKRWLERTRPRWATLSIYNNQFLTSTSTITTGTNLLHGLRGPDYLQVIIPPLRVFYSMEFGYWGGCRLPASRPGRWRTPRRWRRHRP